MIPFPKCTCGQSIVGVSTSERRVFHAEGRVACMVDAAKYRELVAWFADIWEKGIRDARSFLEPGREPPVPGSGLAGSSLRCPCGEDVVGLLRRSPVREEMSRAVAHPYRSCSVGTATYIGFGQRLLEALHSIDPKLLADDPPLSGQGVYELLWVPPVREDITKGPSETDLLRHPLYSRRAQEIDLSEEIEGLLRRFVHERCEVRPDACQGAVQLSVAFGDWCAELLPDDKDRYRYLRSDTLFDYLKLLKLEVRRSSLSNYVFLGLRLSSPGERQGAAAAEVTKEGPTVNELVLCFVQECCSHGNDSVRAGALELRAAFARWCRERLSESQFQLLRPQLESFTTYNLVHALEKSFRISYSDHVVRGLELNNSWRGRVEPGPGEPAVWGLVSRFLAERCVEGGRAPSWVLHQVFQSWKSAQGVTDFIPMHQVELALQRQGIRPSFPGSNGLPAGDGNPYYYGFRLLTPRELQSRAEAGNVASAWKQRFEASMEKAKSLVPGAAPLEKGPDANEYERLRSDLVRRFAHEWCVVGEDAADGAVKLRLAFVRWCRETLGDKVAEPLESMEVFSTSDLLHGLESLNVGIHRSPFSGFVFRGIRLGDHVSWLGRFDACDERTRLVRDLVSRFLGTACVEGGEADCWEIYESFKKWCEPRGPLGIHAHEVTLGLLLHGIRPSFSTDGSEPPSYPGIRLLFDEVESRDIARNVGSAWKQRDEPETQVPSRQLYADPEPEAPSGRQLYGDPEPAALVNGRPLYADGQSDQRGELPSFWEIFLQHGLTGSSWPIGIVRLVLAVDEFAHGETQGRTPSSVADALELWDSGSALLSVRLCDWNLSLEHKAQSALFEILREANALGRQLERADIERGFGNDALGFVGIPGKSRNFRSLEIAVKIFALYLLQHGWERLAKDFPDRLIDVSKPS